VEPAVPRVADRNRERPALTARVDTAARSKVAAAQGPDHGDDRRGGAYLGRRRSRNQSRAVGIPVLSGLSDCTKALVKPGMVGAGGVEPPSSSVSDPTSHCKPIRRTVKDREVLS
jgi:hypothetical protein